METIVGIIFIVAAGAKACQFAVRLHGVHKLFEEDKK